ncbi:C-GCAxxG-C-C family protein [Dysosmobacter sp.]|uniref:C-GCAxxG-C-C family protein n=1 Tax=Dysosmobacter sp. TaxID=2591382 RepID=UPI002A87F227|nr:C-GCAxxG-C-C family protein [Dysosmobacter sp.]MDY3282835.1 C-GCAxxG-C-C family protein [Dysosmobacter sp.]
MNLKRCELAHEYHKKGCNCCQSVLAAFSDLTGLSGKDSLAVGGGFGGGAGTGELCGAISGAVMAIGLLTPVDPENPVAGKKQAAAMAKELQKRFSEKFGAVRCRDLLKNRQGDADGSPAAQAMGLTGHCDIMVVAAVEILEELLAERQA